MPSFLGNIDVVMLTSDSEVFSNTHLEYMAASRPIVATSVGAAEELIQNEVHGLFVPTRDPLAIARGVTRLLDECETAYRLATAARDRAEQRHRLETMCCPHEAAYLSLANVRN